MKSRNVGRRNEACCGCSQPELSWRLEIEKALDANTKETSWKRDQSYAPWLDARKLRPKYLYATANAMLDVKSKASGVRPLRCGWLDRQIRSMQEGTRSRRPSSLAV